MKKWLLSLLLVASNLAVAQDLFTNADLKAGQALVEKNCISCHASSFGDNGTAIYTRSDRKVNSQSALLAQVIRCNTMLDLQWFEDDERNVAAYLNKQYYRFK